MNIKQKWHSRELAMKEIVALYQRIMDREPDMEAYEAYVEKIIQEEGFLQKLPHILVDSPEFSSRIEKHYQTHKNLTSDLIIGDIQFIHHLLAITDISIARIFNIIAETPVNVCFRDWFFDSFRG